MGETCSKAANEAALENRRIEREIRLGLAPRIIRSPLQRSLNESRISLTARQNSHSIAGRADDSPSRSGIDTQSVQPCVNFPPSTNLHRKELRSNVQRVNPPLFSHVSYRRPPKSPRVRMLQNGMYRSAGTTGKGTPKMLPQEGDVAKVMRNGLRGRLQGLAQENIGTRSKSNVKPVVIQALNLLCVEELQCRLLIMKNAMSYFKDLEARFNHHIELELTRAAALELLQLQSKCRISVYEQEMSERNFLKSWINQTVEEARLKELIDATQRPSINTRASLHLSSDHASRPSGLYGTTFNRANTVKEVSYLGQNDYTKSCKEEEVIRRNVTPHSLPHTGNAVAFDVQDIPCNNLNRKIGRQTHLMRDVIPSYSPKSNTSEPGIPFINHWKNREYKELAAHPSGSYPSCLTSDDPWEKRETSSYRALFHDPFRTPLGKSSAQIKGESDLAMRRRLAALLTA